MNKSINITDPEMDLDTLKQENQVYILNPAYYLRNDLKRILLGCFNEPDISISYDDVSIYIHPYHAQMLSFFNGKRKFSECVKDISIYFKMPQEEIEKLILRYIENKNQFYLTYKGKRIYFPRNLLVKDKGYIRKETYQPKQFELVGEVDLDSTRQYKPTRILFQMTMKCYTNCIYCYADRSFQQEKKALSLSRIEEIIKEAKQIGVVDFDVNGGEVLMHKHYLEIFKLLKQNDYSPLISTKMHVSKEILHNLKQIGINHIQISLDSVKPHVLSHILKVGDEYIKGIWTMMDHLQELGMTWQINTIITSFNSSAEDIKEFLEKVFKFKNLTKVTINPAGISLYKSIENFNNLKPSLNMMATVRTCVQEFRKLHPNKIINITQGECQTDYTLEKRQNTFSRRAICTGNQSTFVLLPDGQITICEELYWQPQFIIGNLQNQGIMEMWNSEKALNLFHITQDQIQPDSFCKTCEHFSDCRYERGVCWKSVQYAYGQKNWDYPDPRCPEAPEPNDAFCLL